MAIQTVTEQTYQEEVAKGTVLVDYFADWCHPCKMLAPELEAAAKEWQGTVKVAKVNVDEEQALAAQAGIMGIPALHLLKDGKVVGQASGYLSKEALLQFVRQHT